MRVAKSWRFFVETLLQMRVWIMSSLKYKSNLEIRFLNYLSGNKTFHWDVLQSNKLSKTTIVNDKKKSV